MAHLGQTFVSEKWKVRFSSMSQKSKIVYDFFPIKRTKIRRNRRRRRRRIIMRRMRMVVLAMPQATNIFLSIKKYTRPINQALCHHDMMIFDIQRNPAIRHPPIRKTCL